MYSYADDPVLRSVSLDIRAGEAVALMGPSGCGKSTLLLISAGILVPSAGAVMLGSRSLGSLGGAERSALRRAEVGIVFQFGELIAELSLLENVALSGELNGWGRRKATRSAREMLDRVGLAGEVNRKPGEVSGGQAQRCAVARALVHRPALVIADEPTGALDQRNAAVVLDLMLGLVIEQGSALLLATHDETVACRTGKVMRMVDGRIVGS